MRILMLSWEYPPRIVGGISRVVYGLAQNLGRQGEEVHVVTCWEPGTADIEKDENVYVHRVHTDEINANDFLKWVLHLNISIMQHSVKLMNDLGKFDIIHAHDWIVAFAAKSLKFAYHIPLVCTIHATEYGRNSGIHDSTQKYINDVEWSLTYESWKVIVNSHYMKNEVCNVFRLPEDKIRVIPNGVDEKKFDGIDKDCEFRRKFAADHEKIIFYVGRIVNEKGVHLLIDALPKVLSFYNDVKLVIAGKGPQMDFLKNKADDLRVYHKIYFTGYINDSDLLKLYKCVDIAVFPSLYEPFGIVALEGFLANVPVIVSDTGGLGEIVDHGIDGLKFYNGNANSLADCMLELLYHPERAEEMKVRAIEKIKRIYNWENISRLTLEVYKEVTDQFNKSGWEPVSLRKLLSDI